MVVQNIKHYKIILKQYQVYDIVLLWAMITGKPKKLNLLKLSTINEQISNAFVRLHKPFRQKSTILMVEFCHLP